tara:strand:+ start:245 stop:463 length:219 start_codon:yes stop_codon:yes gene_type:complete
MADVIGLSDVSSKDTSRGSQLKTGNLKRSYNMPSPKVCKTDWKKMGYKSESDCRSYGKKKMGKSKSPMKKSY